MEEKKWTIDTFNNAMADQNNPKNRIVRRLYVIARTTESMMVVNEIHCITSTYGGFAKRDIIIGLTTIPIYDEYLQQIYVGRTEEEVLKMMNNIPSISLELSYMLNRVEMLFDKNTETNIDAYIGAISQILHMDFVSKIVRKMVVFEPRIDEVLIMNRWEKSFDFSNGVCLVDLCKGNHIIPLTFDPRN